MKFKKLFLLIIFLFVLAVGCSGEKTPTQGDEALEAVEYVVTFDVNGKKEIAIVKEGEKITKPASPTKEGYEFAGWYLDGAEESMTPYDFDSLVTADITLTAKFKEVTPEEVKYIVTFDVDGKKEIVEVKEGGKVERPANPVKDGYTFTGWYLGEEQELTTLYNFDALVTADITLVAKFEEIKYVVTFDVDGKKETVEVKEGEKVVKPANPVKEGYKFTGWYIIGNNFEDLYDFEAIVISNITLTAKFEEAIDKQWFENQANLFVESLGEYINVDQLPTTIPNEDKEASDITISYNFDEIIETDGKVSRPADNDKEISGTIEFAYEGVTYSKNITILIYGTFLDSIADEFARQFANGIKENMAVKNSYNDYGTTRVVWESSNEEIFSNSGKYNKPFNDTEITISYFLRSRNPEAKHYYSIKVMVYGEEISYKTKFVKEWLNNNFATDHKLYKDSDLITYVEDYNATVEWLDTKDKKIESLSDYVQNEVLGLGYEFNVKITIEGESHIEKLYYRVWDDELNDKWETIDIFLKAINEAAMGSYVMKMTGYSTDHYGAVYFFNHDAPEVNTEHMTTYTYGYVNTGIKKTSTEYVVVHDTAGGAPTHTAEQFALDQYNKNNNEKNTTYISWHYTVGDDATYQSLPLDEVAYHAGDGSHVYGDIYYNSSFGKADCIGGGNRNGIGIETCVNYGSNYNNTMKRLSKLIVRELFSQFENLHLGRIKQHYHFAGKDCPYVIRHAVGWDKFMNFVAIENFGATELSDVSFEWKSLTPEYLDDTGNVIKKATNVTLKYEVAVTYNNETRKFEYTFSPEVYKYDEVIKHF